MPYVKPNSQKRATKHLYIKNVGSIYGTTVEDVRTVLQPYCSDPEQLLITVPDRRAFITVTFTGPQGVVQAAAACTALHDQPCDMMGGRVLNCKYAKLEPDEADGLPQLRHELLQNQPVACTTEEAGIPGLYIIPDFVSKYEEQQLLLHIDQQPWQQLSKRRVQHYGYKFEYTQRGVDLNQQVEAMPDWTHTVVQRVQELPDVPVIDQLTVNEYTPGVGIAPHVDTHSSFTGSILSLSLLGSCIMVFKQAYAATSAGGTSTASSSSSSSDCGDSSSLGCQQHAQHGQDRQVNVYLPPRSLVAMTGESRYAWQHYIPYRKSDWVNGQQVMRADRRVSLTFRKVRGFPCDCQYSKYCDSQLGVLPPPRSAQLQQQDAHQSEQQQQPVQHHTHSQQHSIHAGQAGEQQQLQQSPAGGVDGKLPANGEAAADEVEGPSSSGRVAAEALEDAHVHQVYDAIASHFSSTRFAVWPKVRAFLEGLAPGSVVADVGCGNGKYLGVRHDLAVLGSDRSAGLAAVAAARLATGSKSLAGGTASRSAPAADVFVCDALQLCYRPCSCDGVLCIAVLHHISSRQRRLALLQQLGAVLRLGGRGLVTVWATQQEDPAKTIQRWHKIQPAAADQEQQQQPPEGSGVVEQQEGGVVEGPDYFVPWHLPFHKAGGLTASAQQQQQQQQPIGPNCGSSAAPAGPPSLAVDNSKRAVVLQRYYHLFEQGELESLVGEVHGLQVVQGFYDRSNWCVEFVKQAQ